MSFWELERGERNSSAAYAITGLSKTETLGPWLAVTAPSPFAFPLFPPFLICSSSSKVLVLEKRRRTRFCLAFFPVKHPAPHTIVLMPVTTSHLFRWYDDCPLDLCPSSLTCLHTHTAAPVICAPTPYISMFTYPPVRRGHRGCCSDALISSALFCFVQLLSLRK